MNEKKNIDYENFKALADIAIGLIPKEKTIRHAVARQLTDDEMFNNLLQRAGYVCVSSIASIACKSLRQIVSDIRTSGDKAGRLKIHLMDDYFHRHKRVKILCDKIERVVYSYYDAQTQYIARSSSENINKDKDFYEIAALMDEYSCAEIEPYIKRMTDMILVSTRDRLRPIDPPMLARCMKVILAMQMYSSNARSLCNSFDRESKKLFLMLQELYGAFQELLNLIGLTDREGRQYLWLVDRIGRNKWRQYVSSGKRHYGGFKIESLHPIDAIEETSSEEMLKVDYEMTRHMLSCRTIDGILRKATGESQHFLERLGDISLLSCSSDYDQFRIYSEMINFNFVRALELVRNLPENKHDSFVAAFNLNDKNMGFCGVWMSAYDAEADTKTDALDIIEIAAENKTLMSDSIAYFADKNKIAYFDYWWFLDQLEVFSTLNFVENSNIKIRPVENEKSITASA